MDQVSLRAETGRTTGSRATRRLRADGKVPAIVYGRDADPIAVAVDGRDLYGALRTEAGLNALINLEVDGDEHLTVAREVQRHPWRNEITHLDFIKISLDEELESEIGIEYLGEPVGVEEGGVVETVQTSVLVSSLPADIPASIPVDISALDVGDSLSVEDLPSIEGVTYVSDPRMTLVTVVIPSEIVEPEPEVDLEMLEGELAEGEELPEGEEAAEEGEEVEASADDAEDEG
ncbi:MAG: 50S ribosomal protein L25 [Acidimicrobiia bacterium]|nr:50S ribosomal protein L25 [Acidimicrobiia bacterium]